MSLIETIEKLDKTIKELEEDRQRLVNTGRHRGVSVQDRDKIRLEIQQIDQTLGQEITYRNAQARLIPAYEHHMRVYRSVESLETIEAQNEREEMYRSITRTLGTDMYLTGRIIEMFGALDWATIEAAVRNNPESVKAMLKDTLEAEAFQINALNGVVDDRVAGRDKYRAKGIAKRIEAIDVFGEGLEYYDKFDENKEAISKLDDEIAEIEAFEQREEARKENAERIATLQELNQKLEELENLLKDFNEKLQWCIDDDEKTAVEDEYKDKISQLGPEIDALLAKLERGNRSVANLRIDFSNPLAIDLNDIANKRKDIKDGVKKYEELKERQDKSSEEFLAKHGLSKDEAQKMTERKTELKEKRKKTLENYNLPEDATLAQLDDWKVRFERLMHKIEAQGITRDNYANKKNELRQSFELILRKYDINPNISEAEMKALMQDIQAEIDKQVEKIREKFNERHVILTAEKMEEAAQVGNTPPPQTQGQTQAQVVQNGAQPQPAGVPAGNTNPVRGNAGAPLGAQVQNIPAGAQQTMLQASQTPQIAANAQAQQMVNQSSRNTETTEYIGASYLDRTYPRQKLAEWNIPSNIDEFMRNAGEDRRPKIKDGKAYSYAVAGDKLIYVEEDIRRYIVNPKLYLEQELEGLRDRMLGICKSEGILSRFADADKQNSAAQSKDPRFAKLVSPKKRERKAAMKEIMKSIEKMMKDGGDKSYAELEMFLALRTAVTPLQVMEALSRDVNGYKHESDLAQTVLREDTGLVFKTHLAVRQKPTLLQEASKTQHRKPKGVMVRPFEIPDSEMGVRRENNPARENRGGESR